jgi:hypothetical protein
MSEDPAQGTDAIFTVNVDGQQIGPAQTVTASKSAGQTETFTFKGNWAPGSHDVTVTFVNNFLYPGTSGDRNLYVNGVTYNGQTVSNGTTPIYESPLFPPNSTAGNIYGNATFEVNDTTPAPSGASAAQTTTPSAVTIGSGADTLKLNMAEDAYQGDAQFNVSVDGKQIGGTQTTTAHVSQGQSQEFDVKGDFGGGSHTVAVTFVNDAIGDFYPAGTPGLPPGQWAVDTTDRNLYVMNASLNGGPTASGLPWELSSNGTQSFTVTAGSGSAAPPASGASASGSTVASGDTMAITSDSVSAGSSGSGMSFIAPPTSTTDDTASGGTSSTDTTSGGSGTTASTDTAGSGSEATTDTTSTLASALSDANTTPAAPTTTGTTASSDQTAAAGGTTGQWWTDNHHGGAWWSHHAG